MPWGIVSGVFGARCQVLEGENEIPCLLRGKFKQEGSACPVAVGDDVEYRMVDARQGVIERVRERRSELRRYGGERQRRSRRGGNQVMLANADQAVFVAAARAGHPGTPRGPPTPRNARLYRLPDGGILADTPGFDMLLLSGDVEAAPPEEALLPEAAPLAPACRFPNCTHRGEAGCAVQAA